MLKYILILVVGFFIGHQSSKEKSVMPEIELGAFAKSEAQDKVDRIFLDIEKQASHRRALKNAEKSDSEVSREVEKYSLHDLSSAVDKKQSILFKKFYEDLKPREDDKDYVEAEYFNKLAAAFDKSNYWIARSELKTGDEITPILLALHFYNTSRYREEGAFTSKDLESMTDVCWTLSVITHPDEMDKATRAHGGDCSNPIRKDGIYYLSHSAYYNNSLNKYFNFFLFPIPQDSVSSLQYVPADQSEWKEGAEIVWESIPGEEMNALGQKYNSVD